MKLGEVESKAAELRRVQDELERSRRELDELHQDDSYLALAPSQVLMHAVSQYDANSSASNDYNASAYNVSGYNNIGTTTNVPPPVFKPLSPPMSRISEEDISARAASFSAAENHYSASHKPTRNTLNPAWLHPNLTKAAAEAVLGNASDGTFLVRRRVNPDEYVLSLMFLGNATHHLIAKGPDGLLEVNKKAYGDAHTIQSLVDALRLPRQDWPQPLLDFVASPEASAADIDAESAYAFNLKRGSAL